MPKAKLTPKERQFNQLQAMLKGIQGKPLPQVDEPPTIARLIILDCIPTLIEKIAVNHAHAMEASKASLEAAGRAAESSKDFAALMAWLRTIGADADYLGLMEKRLRDRLNHMVVEGVDRVGSPIKH